MCIRYCAIDFWTSSAYPCCRIWLHCACCALCWSCTPITAKGWSYRQMWWCSWIRTTIGDLFGGSLVCARPLGSGGILAACCSVCRAARPQKKVCLSCTKCEWNLATKARKKTDFLQEINNASYLVAIRHATGRNTRPLARSSSEAAFSTNTNCLSI